MRTTTFGQRLLFVLMLMVISITMPHISLSAQADTSASSATPPAPASQPATQAPVPAPPPTPPVDPWSLLWQSRAQELATLVEETDNLRKTLPDTAKKLDADIAAIQREYQRLQALYQLSRNMPTEMVLLAGHLAAQERALAKLLAPIKASHDSLQTRLDDFISLEKELSQQDISERSAEAAPELAGYVATLSQGKKRLLQLKTRLGSVIEPGRILGEKIAATRAKIEDALPDLWRTHYLTPSGNLFDHNMWAAAPQSIEVFTQTLPTRIIAEAPQTFRDWLTALVRFLFVCIPVLAVLRLPQHHTTIRESALGARWKLVAWRSLIWVGLGLALHLASWNNTGEVYRTMAITANIFLIWGQIALAWELRVFGRTDSLEASPLRPLFWPVFGSLILLFLNPPLAILGPAWVLILLCAIWSRRRRPPHDTKFLVESNVLFLEPLFQWLALLVAVFGWGRLSILLYMVFVAIAVSIQLGMGLMRLVNRAAERLPTEGMSALLGGIGVAFAAPVILLLVAGALLLWIVAYPGGTYILKHVTEANINVGSVSFNFLRILLILSAFYITRSVISVGTAFVRQLPARGIRMDASLIPPLQTATTYVSWGLFGLYVLHALGVSLTSLTVIAGGLSVGIGFGLQTIFNNFVSGLILIFGRSLQEGDIIDLGGISGTVRKIHIRATTVETFDNAVVFVPNSELVSNRLTNLTRNNLTVRRDVLVGVAYGSDVDLVIKLLREVGESHPNVLKQPAPSVLFSNFGASSLDFTLRVWLSDINVAIATLSELRINIDKVFRDHSVEIAFPQLDLHVRSAEGMKALQSLAEAEAQAAAQAEAEAATTNAKAAASTKA